MTARARILPVDDHGIVADGIRLVLAPWYDILEPVRELDLLLLSIKRESPDLVILDLQMGELSALPVMTDGIARGIVTCPWIVFSMNASRATRETVIARGALACISKADDPGNLLPAVRAALAGERWPPEDGVGAPVPPLVEARQRKRPRIVVDGVSLRPRQVEILLLLRQHLSRKEAARLLGIDTRTIQYHINSLRSQIGLGDLPAILRWADGNRAELERSLDRL